MLFQYAFQELNTELDLIDSQTLMLINLGGAPSAN